LIWQSAPQIMAVVVEPNAPLKLPTGGGRLLTR